MKKIFTLFTLLIFGGFAQDSSSGNWTYSAISGLNINQIALENWTQGGDNSLAFTIFGNLGADYKKEVIEIKNKLKIAYGRTKLGEGNFRTNDNEIYLEDILTYNVGWKVNPFFSNTFRSVLGNGFDYTKTPELQTASFFDPGYLTQSLGFTYDPSKAFNTRLGLAFQEIFTNKFTQYSDDPDTPLEQEKFKFETGIESVSETQLNLDTNILFNSKLRLFSRFNSLDVWDVRWDNTITAKVNNYINVNLNVLIIHEIKQSLKTQLKESLQLGITYTFI